MRSSFIMSILLVAAGCSGDDGTTDTSVGFDVGTDSGMADTGTTDTGASDTGATDSAIDAPSDTSTPDTSMPPMDGAILACTLEELTPIFECAREACIMLPDVGLPDVSIPDGSLDGGIPDVGLPDVGLPDPGELATCILTNCGILVFGVSGECRGCLLAGVGMDLDEIRMSCAPGLPVP